MSKRMVAAPVKQVDECEGQRWVQIVFPNSHPMVRCWRDEVLSNRTLLGLREWIGEFWEKHRER